MAGLKNNLQLKTDLINKINHLTFLNKEEWKYTNFNYLTNFNFKSNDISKNQFLKQSRKLVMKSISLYSTQQNTVYLKKEEEFFL